MQIRLSAKAVWAAVAAVVCGISISGVIRKSQEPKKNELYRSVYEEEAESVTAEEDEPKEAEAFGVTGKVAHIRNVEEQTALEIQVQSSEALDRGEIIEVLISDYFYGQMLEVLESSYLNGRNVSMMIEPYNYMDYYKLRSEAEFYVQVRNQGALVYQNIEEEILQKP